jgi:hypothetical protein
MAIKKIGDIWVNADNISFITEDPEPGDVDGKKMHQIYIHFIGGVESIGQVVSDPQAAIDALNS